MKLMNLVANISRVQSSSKHPSLSPLPLSLSPSLSPVSQMTGRKGRVVSNDDGSISYESRSELDVPVEILNLTEKQRFMDGEKV